MQEGIVQPKPYYCPNCRSNRVKFSIITAFSQKIMKDAVTGIVSQTSEPEPVPEPEPNVQCQVCGFIGNEQRFVKQAEREPRPGTPANPVYR